MPARLAKLKRDPWQDYDRSRKSLVEVLGQAEAEPEAGAGPRAQATGLTMGQARPPPPSLAPLVLQTPFTIFLLSPANLGGERAAMVLNPRAQFALAQRLRSADGAPVGEVFSFVSGLYFRGKMTYAEAFGRPPQGMAGHLRHQSGRGPASAAGTGDGRPTASLGPGRGRRAQPALHRTSASPRRSPGACPRRRDPLRPAGQRGHQQVRPPADQGLR